MKNNTELLFPSLFIANVRVNGDKPLLYERHERMFISSVAREVAADVNSMSRMMDSLGVTLDSRVAFLGLPPSKAYWITEWATFMQRATAVIIPGRFTPKEQFDALAESRSSVVVTKGLAEAQQLIQEKEKLPDMNHIICLEANTKQAPAKLVVRLEDYQRQEFPLHFYADCLFKGKRHPDRTAVIMSQMQASDRALLFFYHEAGKPIYSVSRYTHGELRDHARIIENLLSENRHTINKTDIVLTSLSWNQRVSHISSCLLPVLNDAAIQINSQKDDFTCLENSPHVLIADSDYIRKLKAHIEDNIKRIGTLEWKLFQKALTYGKRKYEKEDNIGVIRKISDKMLQTVVIKRVVKMLGGRLRLIIGVDDAATYDAHTFFHTFGVELVEMPLEAFRHITD